jgi:2-polyprenyl-6-methoxyphenol hydroxylase-like FAD-dependent oxidoreductase
MSKQQNPHNIVILGGGTAGWMTANLMATAWQTQLNSGQLSITLIESPAIGIIGVGEGSTPQLKTFFDTIGVAEKDWMPACNATYKNGILFKNWSTRPGFTRYFHPFTSIIDAHTAPAFVHNSHFKRQGYDIDSHVDRFFLSAALAEQQKAPIGRENFPFDISYGYHFDAVLMGKYLGKVASSKGVKHVVAKVEQVILSKSGDISQLLLDNGGTVSADLFVDCSGFESLLLQKTLQVPFVSFKENLFNDRAVTIATPRPPNQKLNSQTISTAMKYGWAWDIPLTNRTGNGYVYSSQFCSAEQAEQELRDKLGLTNSDIKANHLSMKVGRVTEHWHRNCLAVGLSQGFIEPLEATALHFVQETIEGFIAAYNASFTIGYDNTSSQNTNANNTHFGTGLHSQGEISQGEISQQVTPHKNQFNQKMNNRFDGIRDYIVGHYRLSNRTDTEYWRLNSENPNISNNLKKIVQAWLHGQDLNKAFVEGKINSFYPPVSWHALLAGYGVFPETNQQLAHSSQAHKYDLNHIDQFIQRSALNYDDHQVFLSAMQEESNANVSNR